VVKNDGEIKYDLEELNPFVDDNRLDGFFWQEAHYSPTTKVNTFKLKA
jgi:hypothetical protein